MSKIVLLIILATLCKSLFAYNRRDCKFSQETRNLEKRYSMTVASTVNGGISSIQFLSSWGACSAIRETDEEARVIFLKNNLDVIKEQAALGNGEFLTTLGQLYICDRDNQKYFLSSMKFNYQKIFEDNSNAEEINNEIKKVLLEAKIEEEHCIEPLIF